MLHVLTVATEISKALPLLKSLAAYNVGCVVMGIDQSYPSNSFKINLLRQHLVGLSGFVLFVDGYDCLILRDLSTLVYDFVKAELSDKILYAAERGCWPDVTLWDKYPQASTPYRFLNSGCCLAAAGVLREFLNGVDWQADKSDQLLLTREFLKGDSPIALDSDCQFFQCLWGAENDFRERRNLLTNGRPYVAHANGWSKFPPDVVIH